MLARMGQDRRWARWAAGRTAPSLKREHLQPILETSPQASGGLATAAGASPHEESREPCATSRAAAGSPHRRRRPLLTLGVLAVVGLSLAILGHGQDEAPSPRLTLTSARGGLELSNSRAGRALLLAHRMKPGSSAHGQVTIANTGRANGVVHLFKAGLVDIPGARGGKLSNRLDLVVDEVTGARGRA